MAPNVFHERTTLGFFFVVTVALLPVALIVWQKYSLRSLLRGMFLHRSALLFFSFGLLLDIVGIGGWLFLAETTGTAFFSLTYLMMIVWGTGFLTFSVALLQAYGWEGANRESAGVPSLRESLHVITSNTLVVQATGLTERYHREMMLTLIASLIVGLLLPVSVIEFALPFLMQHPTASLGTWVWALLVFGYGALKIRQLLRERELSQKSGGKDLVLNAEGARCSIGLVRGKARRYLRANGKEFLFVPWAEMHSWADGQTFWGETAFRIEFGRANAEVFILKNLIFEKQTQVNEFALNQLAEFSRAKTRAT